MLKLRYENFFYKQKIDPVYFNKYLEFIESCFNRILPEGTPVEYHHIVSVCLIDDPNLSFMEKGLDNLIPLTYEEHYHAHDLEARAFPEHEGLNYAFWRMNYEHKYDNVEKDLERVFEIKKKHREYLIQRENLPENKEKHSKFMKTLWKTNPCFREARQNPKVNALISQKRRLNDKIFPERVEKRRKRMQEVHGDTVWLTNGKDDQLIKADDFETLKELQSNGYIEGRTFGKPNPDKVSRNSSGRIWVNKNGKTTTIHPENLEKYLSDGWSKGRGGPIYDSKKNSESHKNLVWVTNGKEQKQVTPAEAHRLIYEEGWERGVIKEKYSHLSDITRDRVTGSRWMNKDGVERQVRKDLIESLLKEGWEFGKVTKQVWYTNGKENKSVKADDYDKIEFLENSGYRKGRYIPKRKNA